MGGLNLGGSSGLVPSPNVFADGEVLCFGSSNDACLVWDTSDANANVLMLDFELAGAVNVPVFVIGLDVAGVDLGLFNGQTQPHVAVVDADRNSAITVGFNADNVAEILLAGSATNLLITVLAGNDIILGDSSTILTLDGGTGGGIFTGAVTVNGDSMANGDFIVKSESNATMLVIDANINAVAIGRAPLSGTGLAIGGTISGGSQTRGIYALPVLVPDPGNDAVTFRVQPRFTENSSGVHGLFAGLSLDSAVVTVGVATLTDTAMIYIDAAMVATVSGNNYAIWVNDGLSRFDGDIMMGVDTFIRHDVNATLTASTTQNQGEGPLTAEVNEVSTVAFADDTVTLPTAIAGLKIVIINNGANQLRIFPASSDNLGQGVDTHTTLAAGSNIVFVAYDDTNWEIV